jgi:hypothetical protein
MFRTVPKTGKEQFALFRQPSGKTGRRSDRLEKRCQQREHQDHNSNRAYRRAFARPEEHLHRD